MGHYLDITIFRVLLFAIYLFQVEDKNHHMGMLTTPESTFSFPSIDFGHQLAVDFGG